MQYSYFNWAYNYYGKWRELYPDFCFFEKAENLLSFRQVAKEMLPHLALVNLTALKDPAQQMQVQMSHSH